MDCIYYCSEIQSQHFTLLQLQLYTNYLMSFCLIFFLKETYNSFIGLAHFG
jgi:hypothetical protein